MTRRVCYVSGTRADFGLMRSTLRAIHDSAQMQLDVIATGMHLQPRYGHTVDEIRDSALRVAACVPVPDRGTTGKSMALGIADMLSGITDAVSDLQPDIMLLLGDRGEMLAGAIAAIHLNIPIVHIHGGERSGTVDEPVRHAISKLSHFHFVTTQAARERLIRMGEAPDKVWVTGAPGLDGITELAARDRPALCTAFGVDGGRPVALLVYHPVLQESDRETGNMTIILASLLARKVQVVIVRPNSDAGSDGINQVIDEYAASADVHVTAHFPRSDFVSWMAAADFLIGNTSAGIIEAGTFGTPVINIGARQNLRERNDNVIDVAADRLEIDAAIERALQVGRFPARNVYGDGQASARIASLLASLDINDKTLMKLNSY